MTDREEEREKVLYALKCIGDHVRLDVWSLELDHVLMTVVAFREKVYRAYISEAGGLEAPQGD